MANLPQPRVAKNPQNTQLSYELPHRIHTAKVYPIQSPNGSTVILYGHENGVRIVWRGGRPFKPTAPASAAPRKANGSGAVISLDSDDESEPSKAFEDKPEFEDEEDELDPSRPYPAILQELDLSFGTDVLHLALLPPAILKADGPSWYALACVKRKIVFAAACADDSVRFVTLPLTPPSPASKSRPELRSDFSLAHAGKGTWGEQVVLLTGHHSTSEGLSITADLGNSSGLVKTGTPSPVKAEPHFVVASHLGDVTGVLLLYRISIQSLQSHVEPFQAVYLSSPAKSISFNPALSSHHSSNLLVADSTGVCRIYDYKLLIKAPEESESTALEQGTWLVSLYAGFQNTKNDNQASQRASTQTGFGRKTVIDAQWVSHGKAVIVLLNDGEWAVWDIEGVGPGAPQGLLGRHGIKGGSKSEYSLNGYLDSASKLRSSGAPQVTSSKFAPMTPGTRKSIEPFSTRLSNAPIRGQISVAEVPSFSATDPAEESVLFWFGDTYAIIPNFAKYWATHVIKAGGSGSLFNGTQSRLIKLEATDLKGERCSGVEQIVKTSQSTGLPSDIIILGEHRFTILSAGKETASRPIEKLSNRLALVESSSNPGGELGVVGIEQALTRMENGEGVRRKIFQS